MGHQVVSCGDALKFDSGLFDLVVVLTPEHLQHAIGSHTEKHGLVWIWMILRIGYYEG
jgi:hypothetical protein